MLFRPKENSLEQVDVVKDACMIYLPEKMAFYTLT